jgi:DNA-directed RNA polymerase specialized sigma24 family protein
MVQGDLSDMGPKNYGQKPAGNRSSQTRPTAALLSDLRDGRASAEREFVDKFYGRLYALSKKVLYRSAKAQAISATDVVNLVLDQGIKALKRSNYDHVESGNHVFAVLAKIAKRRGIDFNRRKLLPTVQEADLIDDEQAGGGGLAERAVDWRGKPAEQIADEKELVELVTSALSDIAAESKSRFMAAFIEVYYGIPLAIEGINPQQDAPKIAENESLSNRQIADLIGCSGSLVQQFIEDVARKVRTRLGLEAEEG